MDILKQITADQLLALSKVFNRRWWWTTIIVLLGVTFLVRLGMWQLDRLDQRRVQNEYELQQWRQAPFQVNEDKLPADLDSLANRRVLAAGRFDYANQIVWNFQTLLGQPGVRLVTPLIFTNKETGKEEALLVVRGWVPNDSERQWEKYREEENASIFGLAFKSQLLPGGGMPSVPADPEKGWSYINIDLIQPQLPYKLLPFILVQLPESGRTYNDLPIREVWMPATSEGNHLSYALQWFSFAVIFGVGYLQFILWQERREARMGQGKSDPVLLEPTNQPAN